jgi:hypothetical protein
MSLPRFVRDRSELDNALRLLKQCLCVACGKIGTLIGHSILYGNDPDSNTHVEKCQRGQRVFCSNRGQRGGCGQTVSIYLAHILPRHSVTATFLWSLLLLKLQGQSTNAAVQSLRLPFKIESVYHLLHRLGQRMDRLRAILFNVQRPPESSQQDPLQQTLEHLQSVFKQPCPLIEFQLHFQQPLLG